MEATNSYNLLIILFITALLIPIVPAVIIYKIFPKDKITINGVLSNFTINATGGFGAYIATVILGFSLMNYIPEIIAKLGNPSWNVVARVKFQNIDGKSIDPPELNLINSMRIEYFPPIKNITEEEVRIKIPGLDDNGTLEIGLDGFKPVKMFLANSKRDYSDQKIDIGTITLKQLPPYTPATDKVLTPNQDSLK